MAEDDAMVEAAVSPMDSRDEHTDGPWRGNGGGGEVSRKRARTDTGDEEKRRGKRLFGSLMGTLGGLKKEASSAKAQERAARQAELEQRKKERLQKASDEIAARQAEAAELKRQEDRRRDLRFESERTEALFAHKLLLAEHLSTTATDIPNVMYLPWRLTREQEERIDEQIRIAKREQAEALKLLAGPGDNDSMQVDSIGDERSVNGETQASGPSSVIASAQPRDADEDEEAPVVAGTDEARDMVGAADETMSDVVPDQLDVSGQLDKLPTDTDTDTMQVDNAIAVPEEQDTQIPSSEARPAEGPAIGQAETPMNRDVECQESDHGTAQQADGRETQDHSVAQEPLSVTESQTETSVVAEAEVPASGDASHHAIKSTFADAGTIDQRAHSTDDSREVENDVKEPLHLGDSTGETSHDQARTAPTSGDSGLFKRL